MQDFTLLTDALAAVHRRHAEPLAQLEQALTLFVSYSQDHPARYRLLFSEPEIAAQGGGLEAAAMRCFDAFAVIVRGCQEANALPDVPNAELTGLIYASVHGLIDLQASGRLRKEKGAAHVHEGVALLLRLLSRG